MFLYARNPHPIIFPDLHVGLVPEFHLLVFLHLEGWSRIHARILPREGTAVDRRSENALDMESDDSPFRRKNGFLIGDKSQRSKFRYHCSIFLHFFAFFMIYVLDNAIRGWYSN